MVPIEEDSSLVVRKAEEHIEADGKRKRKKKSKDPSPRPACSWVHFSREFIKEYSSSHPESPGLKAATKAASDAWKSMSQEEKEKYTKRAREVWDNYLTTAPARIPRPRKQTELVTRCSPGRLFNVLQHLTAEQKDAVRSMGFGSLLGLRCRTLRRSLCLWLLERFNTEGCRLEISGVCIPLSPTDVELVLGLAASGKDVVNSGPDDLIADLRSSYNATNHGISVRLLEDRLKAPEAGEDFKRSFVLYALGTLLSPTARLDVSPSFLHFLTNMDVIHQYNWGKFLLDRLVREVSRFHQGKQRAVGGCLLFLQLFYYESVSVGGPCVSAFSTIPCLSSWGEEEIMEREKREKVLGGYGSGEVIWKERGIGLVSEDFRGELFDSRSDGKSNNSVVHVPMFVQEGSPVDEERLDRDFTMDEINMENLLARESVMSEDIDVAAESVEPACQSQQYDYNGTLKFTNDNVNEEAFVISPCACPIPNCNFVDSSEQLSLHFSSKHWDCGTRFRYNSPLTVSVREHEQFLVLQAEQDGVLFLLNKGTENIGNTVMVTCIGPSSSEDKFLYDVVACRGISSLRLKSLTESFPGRVEGLPPLDFLLIPFRFLGSSGQLDLEVCIWNSTELGQIAD